MRRFRHWRRAVSLTSTSVKIGWTRPSSLTDRAAFAAQQASAPELSFRWDWQRARLARQARPDGCGAHQLSPRRRRAAVGAPGHSGRVSRRPLLLSGHLRPGLSRIQRPAAAPGIVRSGAGDAADQGGARHDRAAQGNRAAGLFPGYLRHQLSREAALDRDDRAGHRRDLSDCAARPARAAGQLWRRAAAIHRRRSRKRPCATRFSASANCWRSARQTNTWCRPGSSTTRSSARSSRFWPLTTSIPW